MGIITWKRWFANCEKFIKLLLRKTQRISFELKNRRFNEPLSFFFFTLQFGKRERVLTHHVFSYRGQLFLRLLLKVCLI